MASSRRGKWVRAARFWPAALCILLACLCLLGPRPAAAAIGILVNSADDTVADDGVCTLREAITAANSDTASGAMDGECIAGLGDDTITFAADYTITLSGSALPVVTTTMTITGNGPDNTIIQASTCNPVTRPDGCMSAFWPVFVVSPGNLTLEQVTVRHGANAIRNIGSGSALTVNNSVISNNLYSEGGGIKNQGTLTVNNSVISNNASWDSGGGIYNVGWAIVTNSTFDSNVAYGSSGSGGGIFNLSGVLSVTNSTFSGNHADRGGGITNTYGVSTVISSSTFFGNTGSFGAALSNMTSSPTSVINSLLISFGSANCAAYRDLPSFGAAGSIANDASCNGATPKTVAEINLGPLADNGGPTPTHALLPGSAAIDVVDSAACSAAPVNGLDQRGLPRNADGDRATGSNECDAGAYEVQAAQLTIVKQVSGGPAEWSFAFSGDLGDFNLTVDDSDETFTGLTPGDYDFSETANPDYTATIDCDNDDTSANSDISVTLEEGDDVTCTVTNTYVPPADLFVSAMAAGTISGGPAYGPHDVLRWNGFAWSLFFDGSYAGLMPNGKSMHNIDAIWVPDPNGNDLVMGFAQNARLVPGIAPAKVDGMDLVWYDGDSNSFSLWFDGNDVGLTNKSQEKIDGLHVLDGSLSPIGGGCAYYLLISTFGPGKVPNHSGGTLNFSGEDVLGFCATNLGEDTTGLWHMVLDGSTLGMPKNATTSLSASANGQTLYLTTKGAFNVDNATGGHSMVYAYDKIAEKFSGPLFSAPTHGLTNPVDALDVVSFAP